MHRLLYIFVYLWLSCVCYPVYIYISIYISIYIYIYIDIYVYIFKHCLHLLNWSEHVFVMAFLSNRICLDPLENFLKNPSAAEFFKNTQGLSY